jgi:hypothetical protein
MPAVVALIGEAAAACSALASACFFAWKIIDIFRRVREAF